MERAATLDDDGRTRLRRELLRFVYSSITLPEFNAVENVVLPQRFAGRRKLRGTSAAIVGCAWTLGAT
jgi:lipoprotein-releasing system ATP-binding protein